MTPRERVDELAYAIFQAEGHCGDLKNLNDATKERIEATALSLVLDGWTK